MPARLTAQRLLGPLFAIALFTTAVTNTIIESPADAAGGPTKAWAVAHARNASEAKVVAFAWDQIGKPYWAHNPERLGPNYWDCSGLAFISYFWGGVDISNGAKWPVTNDEVKSRNLTAIPLSQMMPGDLIFFYGIPGETGLGHVGIYVGGLYMIDAAGTRWGVRLEPINQPMLWDSNAKLWPLAYTHFNPAQLLTV